MDYFVDTSVLVRALHPTDPNSSVARRSLVTLYGRGDILWLLPQNVAEFWVVATRPESENGLGFPPNRAARWLRRYEPMFEVLYEIESVYDEWKNRVRTLEIRGKQAHDARLVSAMIVHGIPTVLTLDIRHFGRHSGITVVSPADIYRPA